MTDEERLGHLLRSALPPVTELPPRSDLWPAIVDHRRAPMDWTWLDLGVAAAVALVLSRFPGWLWLLVYHL